MKRIIAKKTLKDYWEKHPICEQYLKTWYETAKCSNWKSPNDILTTYGNASIVSGNNGLLFVSSGLMQNIIKLMRKRFKI